MEPGEYQGFGRPGWWTQDDHFFFKRISTLGTWHHVKRQEASGSSSGPRRRSAESATRPVTDAAIYFPALVIVGAILIVIVVVPGLPVADEGSGAFHLGMSGSIGAFVRAMSSRPSRGPSAKILWAVFLHVGTRAAGGCIDHADSITSTAHAPMPSVLLGRVPLIGSISRIWSCVLLFPGVRELREMDTMKAVIAIVALPGPALLGGIDGHVRPPGRAPSDPCSPLCRPLPENRGIFPPNPRPAPCVSRGLSKYLDSLLAMLLE